MVRSKCTIYVNIGSKTSRFCLAGLNNRSTQAATWLRLDKMLKGQVLVVVVVLFVELHCHIIREIEMKHGA